MKNIYLLLGGITIFLTMYGQNKRYKNETFAKLKYQEAVWQLMNQEQKQNAELK